MPEPVADALDAAASQYPQAVQFIRELFGLSPTLLRGQVGFLIANRREAFWEEAERLVDLAKRLGGSPVESLIEYTVVYLKEQVRFLSTQKYSHQEFETALRDVYDNPEVMEKYYLEGLFMSHAFWPIHLDIHSFFKENFLSRVPNTGLGAEYGFGHGLYLHDILQARRGTSAEGYDISEYSRKFATRLLSVSGIDAGRYELKFADVRRHLPGRDGQYHWAVFAEIMEHIPDPLFSLRDLRRCMRRGAPVFITTVVNSNAIDHLYLFRNPGEVRTMLEDAGFAVADEKSYNVSDYAGNAKDPSIDLAYVGLAS